MLSRGLTSLLDSGKNKAIAAAGPAAAALVLQASKTYPSPHRNTMALKDGTTSKNMLSRGLTSLLDSGKNKAIAALLLLLLLLLVVLLELVLQASKTHPSPHRNTMLLKDGTTSNCYYCCCCLTAAGCWLPTAAYWLLLPLQLLGLLLLLLLLLLVVLLELLPWAPQRSPSGRLRNCKTPWPWRTERPPKTCCPEAWRPFWILVKTKRLQLLGLLLLLLLLLLVVLLELVLQASKTYPSPHRNTMLLKDGTTSNCYYCCCCCCLTAAGCWLPLAAGCRLLPTGYYCRCSCWACCCCSCCCCRWCCWSCFYALKTAPQRSPGGRLRNSKTPWPWRTERPPKTCCPEAWRPFWILVKTKRLQLLGLLLLLVMLLELVLQASKTHPSPHRNTMLLKDGTTSNCYYCCCCLTAAGCWLPTAAYWLLLPLQLLGLLLLLLLLLLVVLLELLPWAPQRSPSGRLRNCKTPWPWRTERPPKTCCPEAWRPFWILVKTKRLQLLGLLLLLLLLLLVVLLELVLQASKTYPSPHRNTMLLKDGTTSNCYYCCCCLTAAGCRWLLAADCCLLATIAAAAAGPAAAAPAAAAGGAAGAAPMPSKQLHSEVLVGGCETAKHHGPEGRNDLQKHAVPRLDVPSGFW